MRRKRSMPRINADRNLPRDLTGRFIEAVASALASDDSPKGAVLKDNWLTKYCEPDPSESTIRRQRAIEKWLSVEHTNSRTNVRLTSTATRFRFSDTKSFGDVLRLAREVCRRILGDAPSLDPSYGGFSGGASTSKNRRSSHPARKFLEEAHVTSSAFYLFYDVIRGTRWQDHINDRGLDTTIVRGNVLFTVPKSKDIDRVAAKEPDLNLFLQKLFGNQIRTLLRRSGVDLNNQGVNAELARQGSVDGQLMTVDLSSASDSVSKELVRFLLPANWFYYLDACRSPFTFVEGVWHENAMFSSMGNGFTFELESLIFYSLARAVAYFGGHRGRISVYGDDIIAPSSMYDELQKVLSFCGFRLNETKSFHEGPFRESCGSWWFNGVDVKPFFLRGPISRTSDLILILNQLSSWAMINGVYDPRYESVFTEFMRFIPERLWGGRDLTSRTSLVTGDKPRKELILVTKQASIDHRGLLLLWLLTCNNRSGISEVSVSDVSISACWYRERRNRQVESIMPIVGRRYRTCYREPEPVTGSAG